QAGGVGLNATTSSEATRYFYSFPANKLELWMSLESDRFLDPVFREFYKEKEVILEERRLRVENSPIGQMIEKFIDAAFKVHPYRRPVIGYDQDIRNLTPEKWLLAESLRLDGHLNLNGSDPRPSAPKWTTTKNPRLHFPLCGFA
ncbi:MAG: M16 family metallopeptidase, partial [Dolichospermum sp.]